MKRTTIGLPNDLWNKLQKHKEENGFQTDSDAIRHALHLFFRSVKK